jgi:hypothetical protein
VKDFKGVILLGRPLAMPQHFSVIFKKKDFVNTVTSGVEGF